MLDHYLQLRINLHILFLLFFILFRFELILIGEIGDKIALVDTDDVDDDDGSI